MHYTPKSCKRFKSELAAIKCAERFIKKIDRDLTYVVIVNKEHYSPMFLNIQGTKGIEHRLVEDNILYL